MDIDSEGFRRSTPRGRRHWLYLIVFQVVMLTLPFAFGLLKLPPPGLIENRVLAVAHPFPANWADVSALPKVLDAYVQDNFPPRAYLISGVNYVRYRLGYSGSKRLVIGKRGWIYYNDGNHFDFHRGRRVLPDDLTGWVTGIRQRVERLNATGARFYAIFPPVKPTIYPEFLPNWLAPRSPETEVDQLISAAHAAGLTQVIDLRPSLLAAKTEQKLYASFDTHWNAHGAYIGYRTLLDRMHEDMPDLSPVPFSEFQGSMPVLGLQNRDLLLMIGIGDFEKVASVDALAVTETYDSIEYLSDGRNWTSPQIIHTSLANGRTLLLMRDSFSSKMLPYLERNFSTIIVTHVQDGFYRQDLIDRYQPDVVVLEVIETGTRFASNPLP
jgi:alginate O-acetyltransferase complex protein AlgJ